MSHHLNTVVAARKADVTEKLPMAENFDITTDGCTHITTNHQYVTIMAHYCYQQCTGHLHYQLVLMPPNGLCGFSSFVYCITGDTFAYSDIVDDCFTVFHWNPQLFILQTEFG